MNAIFTWIKNHIPTRDSLAQNSWTKPFAHNLLRSELWRFNRRTVPRGVGLGIFVANFLPFPGLHTIMLVLLAIPARANIPIGVVGSLAMVPAMPFVIYWSIRVGNMILRTDADAANFQRLLDSHASFSVWMDWLLSSAAPAILLGLFVIGTITGAIGYVLTTLVWRIRIGRLWRRRSKADAAGQ